MLDLLQWIFRKELSVIWRRKLWAFWNMRPMYSQTISAFVPFPPQKNAASAHEKIFLLDSRPLHPLFPTALWAENMTFKAKNVAWPKKKVEWFYGPQCIFAKLLKIIISYWSISFIWLQYAIENTKICSIMFICWLFFWPADIFLLIFTLI